MRERCWTSSGTTSRERRGLDRDRRVGSDCALDRVAGVQVGRQVSDGRNPESALNVPGALAVHELPDGRVVAVCPLIYTYRLIVDCDDSGYADGYCYPRGSLALVLLAAATWDGQGDPPDGWIRHMGSHRRRPDGTPASEVVRA